MKAAVGDPAAMVLAAALLLAASPGAAAQGGCLDASRGHVAANAGIVRVEVAGGRTIGGVEAGVEGGGRFGPIHVSAGAGYTVLDDAPGNPVSLRIRAERALVELVGITLCGALLGGGTVISSGGDRAWTGAGGAALTAARPLGSATRVTPYLGVRGLGGRAGGEVLGEEIVATGGSLGVEGGIAVEAGRFAGAVRATADGFDPGLGPTPYPALAVRLVVGWRF